MEQKIEFLFAESRFGLVKRNLDIVVRFKIFVFESTSVVKIIYSKFISTELTVNMITITR